MGIGVPTTYAGVNFRSRLEARWAAFFDLIKWPWEYEPIDLEGYIPDFVLPFKCAPLLVEVKPAFTFDEMQEAAKRIDRTSWDHEALIVGARLIPSFWGQGEPGLFGERAVVNENLWWGDAHIFKCHECGATSVCSGVHRYHCRVSGCYDGDGHLLYYDPEPDWLKAGNQVQWKAA